LIRLVSNYGVNATISVAMSRRPSESGWLIMKPTQYLAVYKDSEEAQTLYFGPFVSDSVANFFRAALPMPLKGGWARTIPIQPYTAHEAHTVSRGILDRRKAKVEA
jgi:hypothetical protein